MSEAKPKKRGLHWALILIIVYLVKMLVALLMSIVFGSGYLNLIEQERLVLITEIVASTVSFSMWIVLGCKRYKSSKVWNTYNVLHIIAYAISTYTKCKSIDDVVMQGILRGYSSSEYASLKTLFIILMIISTIVKIGVYGCTYDRTETPLSDTTNETAG